MHLHAAGVWGVRAVCISMQQVCGGCGQAQGDPLHYGGRGSRRAGVGGKHALPSPSPVAGATKCVTLFPRTGVYLPPPSLYSLPSPYKVQQGFVLIAEAMAPSLPPPSLQGAREALAGYPTSIAQDLELLRGATLAKGSVEETALLVRGGEGKGGRRDLALTRCGAGKTAPCFW